MRGKKKIEYGDFQTPHNPAESVVAFLCKTASARKVLRHGWVNRFNINRSTIHLIDAAKRFGVTVGACLPLNSDPAKRFLNALIFPDAKRPLTAEVLNRVDLKRLAERFGLEKEAHKYFRDEALAGHVLCERI